MAIGHQIKRYREGLGWKMVDLSAKSGVDTGTIDRTEKRGSESMKTHYLVAIAKALGLTVEQLEDESTDYLPMLLNSNGITNAVDLSSRRHRVGGVPVYTWAELSEGRNMQLQVNEVDDRRYVPWFGDDRVSTKAYAVRIETSSFKGIPAGSDVIFNPGGTWRNGAIAIIKTSRGIALRRMAEDGNRRVLIAHDDAPWQTEPFEPQDEVIGIKVGIVFIDE